LGHGGPDGYHGGLPHFLAFILPASRMPHPTEIKLHQKSRVLEVGFDDGKVFSLSCELLRVYSPSAEVRGHGAGQEVLQVGKAQVEITAIEPVGNYAVRLIFSDGHDTGLYSWDYLYGLGENLDPLWQQYLERMQAAGASRGLPDAAPEAAAAPAPATGSKAGWKKL
jgi:DUF971 family protein